MCVWLSEEYIVPTITTFLVSYNNVVKLKKGGSIYTHTNQSDLLLIWGHRSLVTLAKFQLVCLNDHNIPNNNSSTSVQVLARNL